MANYIRFDWAMKRLLRNKANFGVLEGLLTTLLDEKITISQLLESESNQEDEFDKYNRVDLLALDSKGELILIEVQNNNEYAYFQRMLFGVSKLVTEYINRGEGYENVRKVYSVNIVYFSLGHGKDIVYHGKTEFRGILFWMGKPLPAMPIGLLLGAGAASILLINGISLPLLYRFGAEKARMIYVLTFAGLGALLGGGGAVMDELQQNGTGSGSLPVPLWLAAVLLLAVLALYAVSWRVSVAWYGKYKK